MTIVPINDLSRWDDSERDRINRRIQEVVESGHFMLGSNTKELESQLSSRLDGMNVMCVGNGTDALSVAILGLGLQAGDKIATAANAGGYATGAILRLGCIPILIDVDLETAQMSSSVLSSVLAHHSDIKAVIVTHLYGLMADISAISAITREKKVLLIEDCAQAIGASTDSREAGSWGDASTFSFYPTKNLGCLGDGGAVALKDAIVANHLRQLAQYGWNGRYSVEVAGGFNSRIDEIQAAILVHRTENLEEDNERRRSIVKRYAGALNSQRRMLWKDDSSFVGHLAIMVSATRDADKKALENLGIGTGVHYPITDHQQIAWKNTFADQISPNADLLTSQILTLPCFPKMTEDEVNEVCNALSQLQQ